MVPAVRVLFAFAPPAPMLLLTGAGLCIGSLAWFEAIKWVGGARER